MSAVGLLEVLELAGGKRSLNLRFIQSSTGKFFSMTSTLEIFKEELLLKSKANLTVAEFRPFQSVLFCDAGLNLSGRSDLRQWRASLLVALRMRILSGDTSGAKETLTNAFAASREYEDRDAFGWCLFWKSVLCFRQGDVPGAYSALFTVLRRSELCSRLLSRTCLLLLSNLVLISPKLGFFNLWKSVQPVSSSSTRYPSLVQPKPLAPLGESPDISSFESSSSVSMKLIQRSRFYECIDWVTLSLPGDDLNLLALMNTAILCEWDSDYIEGIIKRLSDSNTGSISLFCAEVAVLKGDSRRVCEILSSFWARSFASSNFDNNLQSLCDVLFVDLMCFTLLGNRNHINERMGTNRTFPWTSWLMRLKKLTETLKLFDDTWFQYFCFRCTFYCISFNHQNVKGGENSKFVCCCFSLPKSMTASSLPIPCKYYCMHLIYQIDVLLDSYLSHSLLLSPLTSLPTSSIVSEVQVLLKELFNLSTSKRSRLRSSFHVGMVRLAYLRFFEDPLGNVSYVHKLIRSIRMGVLACCDCRDILFFHRLEAIVANQLLLNAREMASEVEDMEELSNWLTTSLISAAVLSDKLGWLDHLKEISLVLGERIAYYCELTKQIDGVMVSSCLFREKRDLFNSSSASIHVSLINTSLVPPLLLPYRPPGMQSGLTDSGRKSNKEEDFLDVSSPSPRKRKNKKRSRSSRISSGGFTMLSPWKPSNADVSP